MEEQVGLPNLPIQRVSEIGFVLSDSGTLPRIFNNLAALFFTACESVTPIWELESWGLAHVRRMPELWRRLSKAARAIVGLFPKTI